MPLARVWSVALFGVDGVPVEIEADIAQGMPGVHLMGLPDPALRESKERIKSAVQNSGVDWPNRQIRLALSPAGLPKSGASYDLALACGVLVAAGTVPCSPVTDAVLLGELALDGRLRAVRGVLPALLAARKAGIGKAIVPTPVLAEAALVDGMDVRGADELRDVIAWCRGESDALHQPGPLAVRELTDGPDLADVVGQEEARWALEVAAAGGHHLLLSGPPGTGKTMLAQRLSGLLPALTAEQALETTAIHSMAGELTGVGPLLTAPPFVAPHHSISVAALVGGGTGLARPGAVSRAHNGVLFLDEAAEFGAQRLNSLRTALEEGEVRHARRDGIVRYPAKFQLVLATNLCPCAPAIDKDCSCAPLKKRQYIGRLSGPLLDRVDLRVKLNPVTKLINTEPGESTESVRKRVLRARERAARRWAGLGLRTNAQVPGPLLHKDFRLPHEATAILDHGLAIGAVSARGADRCLRVSWTLCDLAGTDRPSANHVSAALGFRERSAV